MKTIAKISACIACLAILLALWYVITLRLSLSASVTVTPASKDREAFEAIKDDIRSGKYGKIEVPGSAEDWSFVTVKVEIKSYSPFKTEWISLTHDGAKDAITVDQNTWIREIDAFGKLEGDDAMTVTLLTKDPDAIRTAQLEYYIYGRYQMLETKLKR